MKKLKVGIIGLGVGEQHIAGYRKHPACEVVSLCDCSPEKLYAIGKKYPGVTLTQTAHDILCHPDIDIVSIASYDNYHYEQIVTGIEHGKHLFIEKPLCLFEEELWHIQQLLLQHPEVVLSSNLILRMSPRFRALRNRIQAGVLGEVYSIEGDYLYGRIHKIHHGWRGTLPYYSVMLGGGVHMVDLILWLTGDTPCEVTAYGNRIASQHTAFRFHDFVVALIKFHSGMIGKISANFGCVHPHFHSLSVYGTRATFVNGPEVATLRHSRDPDAAPELLTEPYPGMQKGDLIYSFVESILQGTPPEVSVQDIVATMSVCFAIERALHTGTTVPVCFSEGERSDA